MRQRVRTDDGVPLKQRIVIAGFGDTGVLVAIHLASEFEVVGISPKPCLVSGQELGTRLTRPEAWKRDYLMPFERYEKLDRVRTVQGQISRIEVAERHVVVRLPGGGEQIEGYDILVIASGVTNGFWRNPDIEDRAAVDEGIRRSALQLKEAHTIAVVGGGATGVSASANLARQPNKDVHLFYSQSQPLPGYHPKVRARLEAELRRAGVQLHPNHRAKVPDGFRCDRLTCEAVEWSTGQPPFHADGVLWAVGHTRPNSAFVPSEMLDASGFVIVDEYLRVPGHDGVFAVGDIAASDPNRSSARNWGYRIVAHNIRARSKGGEAAMKRYEAPAHRWGSILGVQENGLEVFQPGGGRFRFPKWVVERLLFPLAVRRGIYKGMRKPAGRRGP